MKFLIPINQASKLTEALQKAGHLEIGGQLFGEQMMPSRFLVTEITFQKKVGTFARFMVDIVQAARDATKFFIATKHKYARYNYLGEWHSHPSFAIRPSFTDTDTMKDLVKDHKFKGNFAVLLIVKIENNQLLLGGWVFDPMKNFADPIEIEIES